MVLSKVLTTCVSPVLSKLSEWYKTMRSQNSEAANQIFSIYPHEVLIKVEIIGEMFDYALEFIVF